MKIGILTSSRADYGIYVPLLNKIKKDDFFKLEIIAFGSHLSTTHGLTIKEIVNDDFEIIHKVHTSFYNDSEKGISASYGEIIISFSKFWNDNKYDLVFCLGDRYEMSAAVQASIPFNLRLAHIHGGETTLGAIDNIYRHQITLASHIHLVASQKFLNKVIDLIGTTRNIYNVGSLSLDGLNKIKLPLWSEVQESFEIPKREFILATFHPETIDVNANYFFVDIICEVLNLLSNNYHVIITLPNADTKGSLYRESFLKLKEKKSKNFTLINSFGKFNYFAAMKASKVILGNSSSSIIEAPSFGKYVINVGKRQLGRLRSKNVIDVSYNTDEIINGVKIAISKGLYEGVNEYYMPNTASNIINIIKNDI